MIDLPTLPEAQHLPAFFKPGGEADLERVLCNIEEVAHAHVPDLSTETSRGETASLAYTIARSKTALDAAGKDLNSGLREQIGVVDKIRKAIRERLDVLRDEVRAPLNAWEEAEADRKTFNVARIDNLIELGSAAATERDTAVLEKALAEVIGIGVDDAWQESEIDGHREKAKAIEALTEALARARKAETEAAELVKLREEAAARNREEEAERVEQASRRDRAARLAEEQQRERANQKAEAARLEREKAEAEERARRAEKDAQRREQAAIEAERQRVAAEAEAERVSAARREADREHRRTVKDEAVGTMEPIVGKKALALFDAIERGDIPHISVVY